jgi:ribokinase
VITVVGSLNMDLFMEAARLPAPGETVLAKRLRREPGGKGANQACAAAKMGTPTTLVGAVGRDAFGDELLRKLAEQSVDTSAVFRRDSAETGTAFIALDDSGQNLILVAAGANATLTAADVTAATTAFKDCRAVLTQLESPPEAVAAGLGRARQIGALAVLNPAPWTDGACSDETLRLCDWIIPNEVEAAQLTGLPVADPEQAAPAARCLRQRAGGANVAVTLGPQGVWLETKSFHGHIPAFRVTAVDTVGAGDTFIGAFVSCLSRQIGPEEAARFGCAAAALAVTRRGAQASIPTRAEVDAFLARS